jgi:hypothetical protein
LAGSHSLNHNIPRALAVLSNFGSVVDKVVSHKLPLNDISKLLDTALLKNSLKVQWIEE